MNFKIKPFSLACIFILLASCSHKIPAPDNAQTLVPVLSPTPVEAVGMPSDCPGGACSKANLHEYIKAIVLPKITHSNVVHDCFLSNPRASKKELSRGTLSFDFEAKLVAEENRVILKEMRLKSYQNVPRWAKACLVSAYQKFTFPPFADPSFKHTSAFGRIDINWTP